jgi:tRNA(fMet)-specific endonuclease VapC
VILDTNALSAVAEGNQAVRELISTARGPYLPVIVVGEYRFGVMLSRRSTQRLAWLAELTEHWAVLDVTRETAIHYSNIRLLLKQQARPIPVNDMWIGALARQHSMPILTNDKHFDDIPGIDTVGW